MRRRLKNKEIVFYDAEDDFPIQSFTSIWEIVEFRKLERTKKNYDIVLNELYSALKRTIPLTRMLGRPMNVYLFDIYDETDD